MANYTKYQDIYPHKKLKSGVLDPIIARLDKIRNAKGGISVADLRLKMQRTMQDHAAVFRTKEILEEGRKLIDDIRNESVAFVYSNRRENTRRIR